MNKHTVHALVARVGEKILMVESIQNGSTNTHLRIVRESELYKEIADNLDKIGLDSYVQRKLKEAVQLGETINFLGEASELEFNLGDISLRIESRDVEWS